jgi:hypothetical protein
MHTDKYKSRNRTRSSAVVLKRETKILEICHDKQRSVLCILHTPSGEKTGYVTSVKMSPID